MASNNTPRYRRANGRSDNHTALPSTSPNSVMAASPKRCGTHATMGGPPHRGVYNGTLLMSSTITSNA